MILSLDYLAPALAVLPNQTSSIQALIIFFFFNFNNWCYVLPVCLFAVQSLSFASVASP
jgi:hypothetical protein